MIKDRQESSLKFKKQKYTLKVFLVISLVVFLFVFVGVINVLLKNKNEEKNINDLYSQSEDIKNKNNEIKNLIKNYNDETSKEKMAREDLNMMADGENVVVVNDGKKEIQINKKNDIINKNKNISNYNKWINFFFGKE